MILMHAASLLNGLITKGVLLNFGAILGIAIGFGLLRRHALSHKLTDAYAIIGLLVIPCVLIVHTLFPESGRIHIGQTMIRAVDSPLLFAFSICAGLAVSAAALWVTRSPETMAWFSKSAPEEVPEKTPQP